jgi:hypothetical protein
MTPRLPSCREFQPASTCEIHRWAYCAHEAVHSNFQAPVSWASRMDGLLACSLRSLHKAAPLGSCAASLSWVRRRHSPVCYVNARPEGEAAKTAARSRCCHTLPVLGAGKAHESLASRARLSQCGSTVDNLHFRTVVGISLELSDERLTARLPTLVYARAEWENKSCAYL